ncbi:hypothetical protein Tco_0936289 [Tanacetum coccineum]
MPTMKTTEVDMVQNDEALEINIDLLEERKEQAIESHKSLAQHSINDFVIINIPEEDVEPKPIILDPDDQPMWESAKTVAPTPNSAIIQLDVDDNFVINSTHLNMIRESKFDGYPQADPHDHIREFLAICDMFKYGNEYSQKDKKRSQTEQDRAREWNEYEI